VEMDDNGKGTNVLNAAELYTWRAWSSYVFCHKKTKQLKRA
jgi:hypothetical protein